MGETEWKICEVDLKRIVCITTTINVQVKRKQLDQIIPTLEVKRRIIQETKKLNCPAKVKFRMLIKFPECKVEGENNKQTRQDALHRLRSTPFAEIEQQYGVLVKVCGDHNNHLIGEIVELILDYLSKHYLIFLLDPVRPATAAQIMFIEGVPVDSKLAFILMAEKLLSPHYLTQVLIKDVMS